MSLASDMAESTVDKLLAEAGSEPERKALAKLLHMAAARADRVVRGSDEASMTGAMLVRECQERATHLLRGVGRRRT
jgi:hypothetical protein